MQIRKWFNSRSFSIWRLRVLLFLSVVGPGIITGTADNDAGGVATYSVVGAHFGYRMLWLLLFIIILLYITQEMGMRLGVVTGKGLGDLIREKLGIRMAVGLMLLVFVANYSNILADMAGVASVADIYHMPRLFLVTFFAIAMWLVIIRGNFNFVQNIFLTSSLLFFCYVINGFIAKPDLGEVVKGSFIPYLPLQKDYIFTATAAIGTTLTVWGQFFIQSFFVDKGVDKKHIKNARMDILLGAFWTGFVAFFIIVSCAATLYVNGISIEQAADAALALGPLLGDFSKHLFAWGLLNASLLGVCVISMGTAYAITEVLGTERKVDASFHEAPLFYFIIGFCIFSCAFLVQFHHLPIIQILVASQAINTCILPFILFVILKLINDKSLMGTYANRPIENIISWVTIVSFTLISVLMLALMFF